MAEAIVGRAASMDWLDPNEVEFEPGYNVSGRATKIDAPDIIELAHDLVENGQEVPVSHRKAKDGKVYIVAGHRRTLAARYAIKHLGWEPKGLKSILFDSKASEVDRIASLLRSNNGLPLTPLQKAEVVARLHKMGLNDTDIGKKVGMSQPYVSNLMALYAAPQAVKNLVETGKVSATEATKTLREHPEKAAEILSDAVAAAAMNGSGRATAQHTAAAKAKKKLATSSAPLWSTRPIARGLVTTLCEVYVELGRQGLKPTQSYRGWIKDALANADVNITEWLKENAEPEG